MARYIKPEFSVFEDSLVKGLWVYNKDELKPKVLKENRTFAKDAARTRHVGTLLTYRVWVYHPNEKPPSWVRAVEQPTLEDCLNYGGIYFAKTHAWIMFGHENPRIAKDLDNPKLPLRNKESEWCHAQIIQDGEAVASPDNAHPFTDHGMAWPHVFKLCRRWRNYNVFPEVGISSNEDAQAAIDNILDVQSIKEELKSSVKREKSTHIAWIRAHERLRKILNECVIPCLTPAEDRLRKLYEIMDGFSGEHIKFVEVDEKGHSK